jgi:cytoskeletal protein CcmA (bactofilin family)
MMAPNQDATVLAPGCALSGRVSGRDLDVLGRFEGELKLSGRVRLAPGSQVKARVRADLVEIEGDFEGEVRARTLRVGESAHAHGIFFADRIAVREGAWFEGGVNPGEPVVTAESVRSSSASVDEVGQTQHGPAPIALT